MYFHRVIIAELILGGLALSGLAAEPLVRAAHESAHLRRPVAAGLLDEGRLLALANQRSGSLSLIDLKTNRVVCEEHVGGQLSGLAVLPDGKRILVTDEKRHELVALLVEGDKVRRLAQLAVAPYPANVVISPDGKLATVAGRWSRKLQVIDVSGTLRVRHSVSLPFAPRLQLPLPGTNRVVVADAFGGGLALVDCERGRVLAAHELEGHNLAGLALGADGKELLIAHQILDQKRPVTEAAIEQGLLIRNVVRRLPRNELTADGTRSVPATFRLDDGWIHGAADPAGIAVLDEKRLAVALAGNNSVALLNADYQVERRINVGARPTLILREPGGDLLVVNTLSDSISRIDPSGERIQVEIPLGPMPRLAARDRGELLFHDASLSLHGWMSCHSCHADGHTNGLLADTSGDGSFGAPKRTLTLRGTALTDRWGWNGDTHYLHEQVRKSLDTTLHGPWASPENVRDLVDYLHSLSPAPAVEPARGDKFDREQVTRGRKLFAERGCVRCHVPPLTYSSFDSHDVGFTDERGRKKFNPPSLRGVSQGKRFFHDNRADSLRAVFIEHGHGLDEELDDRELADLLRFLRSL
jgi:hypothetical protein